MKTEIEEKTRSYGLFAMIESTFGPLENLISFSNRDYGPDNEMNDFHPLLETIKEKVQNSLEKICDCISESLGEVKIYEIIHGEHLKMNGKHFWGGDLVLASIEKPAAKIDLDSDSREALFRVSKERLSREKKDLEEMAARLIKLGQAPEIDPQELVISGGGFKAWVELFWRYLEAGEIKP